MEEFRQISDQIIYKGENLLIKHASGGINVHHLNDHKQTFNFPYKCVFYI